GDQHLLDEIGVVDEGESFEADPEGDDVAVLPGRPGHEAEHIPAEIAQVAEQEPAAWTGGKGLGSHWGSSFIPVIPDECPRTESNLVPNLRRVVCDPPHPEDKRQVSRPGLEPGSGRSECPMLSVAPPG